MLGKKLNPLVYIVTVLLGVLVYWIILSSRPAPQPRPVVVPPAPPVDVLRVEPANHRVWLSSQGIIKPKTDIELVAQVSGRVIAVDEHFASGGVFAADQALVTLEQSDYRIAISQARAELARAQQQLASERGAARQARREWRDLGDEEANALFLRKPQLASAEAGVEAAKAALQKAELDLARTMISAPFSGKVLSRAVGLGQYVVAGSPVGRVHGTERAEVRLPLTARDRQLLTLGEDASPVMLVANYGDREFIWPGKLERVEAALDSQSRQFYAVASIEAPFVDAVAEEPGSTRPALLVDQFVRARIAGGYQSGSLLLPRSALRQPQRIWLHEAGKLRFVDVDVIQSDSREVLVKPLQSMGAGPVDVIVSELSLALDGMAIALRDREQGPLLSQWGSPPPVDAEPAAQN